MPFTSKSQVRKCYAEKKRNPKSKWDCDEFAKETQSIKKLPERVKKKAK